MPHADNAVPEVNVFPLKATNLSNPHSGKQSKDGKRPTISLMAIASSTEP
jgi:hypothetical protein